MQQVRRIGDGGFKLTMARYYTPGGTTPDKVGIAPDVVVEEPKPTPEQEDSLGKLLQDGTVRKWVAANPQPSDAKVGQFVAEQQRLGIALDERTLRRLVRQEVNRTNNNPPAFDLEYDIVLQAAVKAIQAGQVPVKALP